MKKAFLPVCCALLLCLLSGCTQPETEAAAVPCENIVAAVAAGQGFAELTQLSENQAGVFLDLEADSYEELLMTMDATRATTEMVVVMTAKDAEGLTELRKKTEEFLANLTEEYRSYAPEEVPKLESALLETRGLQLVLVVSKDAAQAKKDLAAAWGQQ